MPASQRAEGVKRYMTEQGFRVIAALDSIAKVHHASLATVALAWLMAKPTVVAPIVGANTPEQLADLLPAPELRLDAEELKALDGASAGM